MTQPDLGTGLVYLFIGAVALVAMAVYIGNTRLIDNFIFEEGN